MSRIDLPIRLPKETWAVFWSDHVSYTPQITIEDFHRLFCSFYYDHEVENGRLGRNKHLLLNEHVRTGKVSYGQWAVEIEGVLKGQIFNGGVEQFFYNSPYLISHIPRFIEDFGTGEMYTLYNDITSCYYDTAKNSEPLTREIIDDLVKKHLIGSTYDSNKEKWDSFANLYTDNTNGWYIYIEKKILKYCKDNPSDFVV